MTNNNNKRTKSVSTNTHKKPYNTKTKQNYFLKILRYLFTLLDYFSPSIAGWWAARLWLSTRRFPEPSRETSWLKTASVSQLTHKYGPITLYQWHSNQLDAPRVVLIHGWNGRGLQLAAFVQPLIKSGFQVVSFDAPGHGRSAGKESNLLRIADVVHEISKSIGPIDSIIGHSFGAMVMARVARDNSNIRKAIAISSPLNADYLLNGFCTMLNIKGSSKENLLTRIHQQFGDDIFSRISAVNNVKHLGIPGLIIHDRHDPEIPTEHAHALNKAWTGSELLITENLGHLRILRNETVINEAINFITKK